MARQTRPVTASACDIVASGMRKFQNGEGEAPAESQSLRDPKKSGSAEASPSRSSISEQVLKLPHGTIGQRPNVTQR
jgi:hypothetical protein